MFRTFLRETGKSKDDVDVIEVVRERSKRLTFSTADVPHSLEDESTAWRNNEYPKGLNDHPVAVITLYDAVRFCDWLSRRHTDRGWFRLPTWNEWMIAAYGAERAYPWGNEWDTNHLVTSHGLSWENHRVRASPVRSKPSGRTPEGLYGMLGNVHEYLAPDDARSGDYFNLGARWMGGSFIDGYAFHDEVPKIHPRQDYWGYSHHGSMRTDGVGFRVVLDPTKNEDLLVHPRVFEQANNSWRVE